MAPQERAGTFKPGVGIALADPYSGRPDPLGGIFQNRRQNLGIADCLGCQQSRIAHLQVFNRK